MKKDISMTISVLHIITRMIVGGAQLNTLYTSQFIDKKRFKVQILSGPQAGPEGNLFTEVQKNNIPLAIEHNLVREINPIKDFLAFLQIIRFIKKNKFLIVHTHSSKAGFLGRLAAHIANTPIIVHTVHGWSFHQYMSPFKRYLYITLEKIAARYSDALIVVTKLDISKGIESGIASQEKYHLIHSSIPVENFEPKTVNRDFIRHELGIPTNAIVVGSLGRLSTQKNPLTWLRIAELIHAARPNVYFLMVGDGPMRDQVEEFIFKSNLQDNIILTGLRKDTSKMLKAMDIFLLTSLWEGLPRVIPEANLMKIPVIAFDADGIKEAIIHKKTGFLCSPGNINQIVNYCILLIDDNKLRKKMGEIGRDFALKNFNLHDMIIEIEQLYEKLLYDKLNSSH